MIGKCVTVYTTKPQEEVINDSNGNKKVECSLRKDGEPLQRPCVTVTQEEWDSSIKIMNNKWIKIIW